MVFVPAMFLRRNRSRRAETNLTHLESVRAYELYCPEDAVWRSGEIFNVIGGFDFFYHADCATGGDLLGADDVLPVGDQ